MEERLDIFLKSVTEYADTQCRKLERTAETQMQKEITAYKKQAAETGRSNTSREIEKIQSDAAFKAAEYASKKRRALSSLKNELAEDIFSDAELKIKDFTASDGYSDFLKRSAESLVKVIGSEIVFYLRPCDMRYSDALKEQYKNAEIRENENIHLGGIIATDKNEALRADDTLDSRFISEKKAFFESADFKVF